MRRAKERQMKIGQVPIAKIQFDLRSRDEIPKILIGLTVRLSCNWDYDKLTEIVNNHKTLRLMLGHSDFGDESRYALQTLKDNVSLFTPEALDRINQIVVEHGHELIGKKKLKRV